MSSFAALPASADGAPIDGIGTPTYLVGMGSDHPGYSDPKLAINRVYTKKGDAGKTALVGGQRVDKDDLRIEAYGTVDELIATIGAARQSVLEASVAPPSEGLVQLAATLLRVQHELFNLGSLLATLPEDLHPKQPRVGAADVAALEREMDRLGAPLEPLRSFVLPGGGRANTDLHMARTICRRAERRTVALARASETDPWAVTYLNRLSDALFVWSRWVVAELGESETLWQPNQASSGSPG
jgi:cob(I)alamin adenosyltransferase